MAAHRVPPQMMGVMLGNVGGFGDVEKSAKVFFHNEIKYLLYRLFEINKWVDKNGINFDTTPLRGEGLALR